MGLSICLQKESGRTIAVVDDPRNLLHRLLPQTGEGILNGIDWYGDTIFNSQQMKQFIPAWQSLFDEAAAADDKALLSSVMALAERCANGTHLYLKFEGD
jgi:hypothetical protein